MRNRGIAERPQNEDPEDLDYAESSLSMRKYAVGLFLLAFAFYLANDQ